MASICLTVDVEDWYDGMEVLGDSVTRPEVESSGLSGLSALLAPKPESRITLFVVGNYADKVASDLGDLVQRGHEIASHGPDHGRLPSDAGRLLYWLRSGRGDLENRFQVPVIGFRSPRFDLPAGMSLAKFRDLLAEAGFRYVSDTHCLGESSPISELPVLQTNRLPLGGGSYQRLIPHRIIESALDRQADPSVLYYHSYDFGASLPKVSSIRSMGVAKQLVGRNRIMGICAKLLDRYVSESCARASS